VRKGLVVVAGGLVSALVFSGCFGMRSLTYTDDTVQAGKKTTAKISVVGETDADMMARLGASPGGEEHPFFYFLAEGGSTLANGGKFDTKGVYSGPVALEKDPALASAVSEECDTGIVTVAKQGPPIIGQAVTTEDPFEATNPRKFMDARLPIRATESGNVDAFIFFMGSWYDDGDGTAEPESGGEDDYDCVQPPYTSAIKIKGAIP
jgi:hypothetical protein